MSRTLGGTLIRLFRHQPSELDLVETEVVSGDEYDGPSRRARFLQADETYTANLYS